MLRLAEEKKLFCNRDCPDELTGVFVKKDPFSVLLIDDDTDALEITKSLFSNAGIHPVYTLNDSRQVLSFLHEHEMSLVVLDLVMPYLSGLDLLPQIRQHFPNIPVIVGSASSDIKTAVTCMQHGVVDFHVKPIDVHRLIGSVKEALKINNPCQHIFPFKPNEQCL